MEVKIHSRKVMVKGPRGVLRRNFRHLQVDISKPDPTTILVEKWFGIKSELAAVRTVCSHIENMFKGVMKVSPGHKPVDAFCKRSDLLECLPCFSAKKCSERLPYKFTNSLHNIS